MASQGENLLPQAWQLSLLRGYRPGITEAEGEFLLCQLAKEGVVDITDVCLRIDLCPEHPFVQTHVELRGTEGLSQGWSTAGQPPGWREGRRRVAKVHTATCVLSTCAKGRMAEWSPKVSITVISWLSSHFLLIFLNVLQWTFMTSGIRNGNNPR